MEAERPPLPPFTSIEAAVEKVRLAEDAWNSRDPERVSLAYTQDSRWRNRVEFIEGREEIKAFLARKWSRELDYRLRRRIASINDLSIRESDRLYHWPMGRRPDNHPSLSDLGL
jgi:nuclear transport factor 2 (NTF2) superfamily protein